MRGRRVRERNIRLLWQETSGGAEMLRDFTSVSEAREAVDSSWDNWVIFEIDHPHYAARGRVLDESP